MVFVFYQVMPTDNAIEDLSGNPAVCFYTEGFPFTPEEAQAAMGCEERSLAVVNNSTHGSAPSVEWVAVTSDPGEDGYYAIDDTIELTATFTEAVDVTGAPRLRFNVGSTTESATYVRGSGTDALVFAYTVVEADAVEDHDGISIPANNIRVTMGVDAIAASLDATAVTGTDLDHTEAVGSQPGHKVDGVRPRVLSAGTSSDGSRIIVTFSEALGRGENSIVSGLVTIDSMQGFFGTASGPISGATLEYSLSVTITSGATGITVNFATDEDTPTDLAGNQVDSSKHYTVTNNFVAGGIAKIEIPPAPAGQHGFYKAGDTITATVTFNEAVALTGTPGLKPRLALNFFDGATAKSAVCAIDSTDAKKLLCIYTVVQNDTAPDGIKVDANSLTLPAGAGMVLVSDATVSATLTHDEVGRNASAKVDGERPAFFTAETPADGETVIATFGEALGAVDGSKFEVSVDGTVWPGTQSASIDPDDATKAVIALENGLGPLQGTTIALSVAPGGATDLAGNANTVTYTGAPVTNNAMATPPTLVEAALTSNGTQLRLLFDEALDSANPPDKGQFTLTATNDDNTVVTINIGGIIRGLDAVLLTGLSPTVVARQELELSYNDTKDPDPNEPDPVKRNKDADDTAALQDAAGNDVADFTTGEDGVPAAVNNLTDVTAPALLAVTASPNGLGIVVRFDETIDPDNLPGAGDFTVRVDDDDPVMVTRIDPANVMNTGRGGVLLVLGSVIYQGRSVVVSYDPTMNMNEDALQDAAGNAVAAFTTGVGGVGAAVNNSTQVPDLPDLRPGETLVWEAALTVEFTTGDGRGCEDLGDCARALTSRTFEFDGVTYTVEQLAAYALPRLLFDATGEGSVALPAAGLELEFLGGRFPLSEGSLSGTIYAWTDNVPSWSVGEAVPVRLIRTDPPPDLQSAAVEASGTEISLVFDETLSTVGPPTSWITVEAGTGADAMTAKTVNAVIAGGKTVRIMIDPTDDPAVETDGPIERGHGVVVTYCAPALAPCDEDDRSDEDAAIQSALGTDAGFFTAGAGQAVAVLNNSGVGGAPSVTNVEVTSTVPAGQERYRNSDPIRVTVTFSEAVTVTGQAGLALGLGAGADEDEADRRTAVYETGSLTNVLVFLYIVSEGDVDGDGIEVVGNSLAGTIVAVTDQTAANLAHAGVEEDSEHLVDGTRPTFVSAATDIRGTTIVATFSEAIDTLAAEKFTVRVAGVVVTVTDVSVSATDATMVELTLGTAIADEDATVTLSLERGAVSDENGNASPGEALREVDNAVDATGPALVSAVVSTDGTEITLTFDETLDGAVRADPSWFTYTNERFAAGFKRVALQPESVAIDGKAVTLTVSPAPAIVEGVPVVLKYADPSAANDAAALQDDIGNDVPSFESDSGGNFALLTNMSTAVPTVSEIALNDPPQGQNGFYKYDDTIEATVTFTHHVNATGTPMLALKIGDETRQATYVGGGVGDKLRFAYTVQSRDSAPGGVSIGRNALSVPEPVGITSGSNYLGIDKHPDVDLPAAANLEHGPVAANEGYKVDGVQPKLIAAAPDEPVTSPDGTKIVLTFDEPIASATTTLSVFTVTSPAANPVTGATPSGRRVTLTLTDTITDPDADVEVTVTGAAAYDLAGNFNANSGATAVRVRLSSDPVVTGIEIGPAADPTGFYGVGDAVQATVTFSESVTVTGEPQLEIDVGGTPKTLTYDTGSGMAALVFTGYAVAAGDEDEDEDGISVEADKLVLNGGTIVAVDDSAPADLAHRAEDDDSDRKVDGVRPALDTANPPRVSADGTKIVVAFAEAVTVGDAGEFEVRVNGAPQTPLRVESDPNDTGKIEVGLPELVAPGATVALSIGAGAALDRARNGNAAESVPSVSTAGVATWSLTLSSAGMEVCAETDDDDNCVIVEGGSVTAKLAITNSVSLTQAREFTLKWGVVDLERSSYLQGDGATTIEIPANDPTGSGELAIEAPDGALNSYELPLTLPLTASLGETLGGTVVASVNLTWRDDELPPVVTIAEVKVDGTAVTPVPGIVTVAEGDAIDIGFTANPVYAGGSLKVRLDVTDEAAALGGTRSLELGYALNEATYVRSFEAAADAPGCPAATVALAGDPDGDTDGPYTLGDPSSVTVWVDDDTAPGEVQGLKAKAGNTQVELEWEEPEEDTGGCEPIEKYQYRFQADGATSWGPATTGDGWEDVSGGATARSVTVADLDNDDPYTFEVRAVNGHGDGEAASDTATPSDVKWKLTLSAAEVVEGGADVTATVAVFEADETTSKTFATEQTVTLAWGAAPLTGAGAVLVKSASGSADIVIPVGDSSGTLTVRARNDQARQDDYGVPETRELTATLNGGGTVDSADLAWRDNDDAPSVRISVDDTEVTEGEDIEVTATLSKAIVNADAPIVLTQTGGGGVLSAADLDADGLDPIAIAMGVTSATAMVATEDDATAEDPSTVTFALAENPDFAHYTPGDPSEAAVTVTDNDTVPDAPVLTGPAPAPGRVALAWATPDDNGSDITGYQYRHRTTGAFGDDWTDIADSAPEDGANANGFTVTDLDDDTEYSFQVRAVNGAGESDPSNERAATTPDVAWVLTLTGGEGPRTVDDGNGGTASSRVIEEGGDAVTATLSTGNPETYYLTGRTFNFTWRGFPLADSTLLEGEGGEHSITVDAESDRGMLVINAPDPVGPQAYIEAFSSPLIARLDGVEAEVTRAWLTWQDNEDVPAVSIAAVNGDAATEDATFTVTEGGSIEVTAEMSPVYAGLANVPLTVTHDGDTLTGTIHTEFSFSAGQASQALAFTTDGADTAMHEARTVTFALGREDTSPFTLGAPYSVTVTVLDDDTPPSVPLAVRARPGDRQVTLTWKAPADGGGGQAIAKYRYRYRLSTSNTWIRDWTDIPGGDADTRSYTQPGLTNDMEYRFELRAVSAVPLEGEAVERDVTPAEGVAVTLSADPTAAPEGGSIVVTVTLATAPAEGESVEVPLSAAGLEANETTLEASEFSGVPASVTFVAGDDEEMFTVTFADDGDDERDEVLAIAVGDLPDGYIAGPALELTVLDDEVTASIAAAPKSVAEGASVEVTVTLTDPPRRVVEIPLTASGLQPADYVEDGAPPASVEFGEDDTVKRFTVTLEDDAVVETETLTLAIGTPLPAGVLRADADARSAAVTVVDDDGAPDAPANLSATGGDGLVNLAWRAVVNDSPVTKYQVRWKRTDALPFDDDTDGWTDVGDTTSHEVSSGLVNDIPYTFEVRAVNDHGAGAPAEAAATPTEEITGTPRAVHSLSLPWPEDSRRPVLSWSPPANVGLGGSKLQGYEIGVCTYGEEVDGEEVDCTGETTGWSRLVADTESVDGRWTDTLGEGVALRGRHYRVRAININGKTGPWSNTATAPPTEIWRLETRGKDDDKIDASYDVRNPDGSAATLTVCRKLTEEEKGRDADARPPSCPGGGSDWTPVQAETLTLTTRGRHTRTVEGLAASTLYRIVLSYRSDIGEPLTRLRENQWTHAPGTETPVAGLPVLDLSLGTGSDAGSGELGEVPMGGTGATYTVGLNAMACEGYADDADDDGLRRVHVRHHGYRMGHLIEGGAPTAVEPADFVLSCDPNEGSASRTVTVTAKARSAYREGAWLNPSSFDDVWMHTVYRDGDEYSGGPLERPPLTMRTARVTVTVDLARDASLAAPGGLTAERPPFQAGTVDLDWDAVAGATQYEMQWKTGGGDYVSQQYATGVVPNRGTTTDTHFRLVRLDPAKPLTVRLRAVKGNSAVGPWTERTFRTVGGIAATSVPKLTVANASVKEGESGGYMTFTLTLNPAVKRANASDRVTVHYRTEEIRNADGTPKPDSAETAGSWTCPQPPNPDITDLRDPYLYCPPPSDDPENDFEHTFGTLYFERGETTKTVRVRIFDDNEPDSGEKFHLVLHGATNAEVADGVAVGTIINTEAPVLTGFTLVDAASGTALGAIANGAAFDIADPASGRFGIVAGTAAEASIGSVRIELTGPKTAARTDNAAPYALFGEAGEGLAPGAYALVATAYKQADAAGGSLNAIRVGFTVGQSLAVTTPGPFTVDEGETAVATLAASDTGGTQSRAWTIAGGADAGAFAIGESLALAFREAKDFEAPDDADGDGTYEVTVRVAEGDAAAEADLRVTVADVNEAPVAQASVSAEGPVDQGAAVTLDGSASADPDADDTLAFLWTQSDTGAHRVALAHAAAAKPSFTAPVGLTADAALAFTLRVTDAAGLYGEDTVSVTVSALPVVSIAAASGYAREGADAVFALVRVGDVSAALTVPVTVSESGPVLGAPVPAGATFAAGAAAAELRVPTDDDGADEPAGTVTVALADGAGWRLGPDTASVTVLDDDAAAPAEGPPGVVLWSAEMQVQDFGAGDLGAASADRFSNAGGTAGLVAKWLWYSGSERQLRLAFTAPVPRIEGLTLHAGGTAVALDGGQGSYTIGDVDVGWTAGETVAVRLVQPSTGAVSGDAALKTLALEGATLDPAFDADVLVYRAAVDDGAASVTVTAQASDADAGVAIGPEADADTERAGHQVAVRAAETLISVVVTAPDGAGRRDYWVVAERAGAPENAAPTGLPAIAGTPRVGETLEASADGIADADGLTGAAFAWQWLAHDGTAESPIAGAASSSYTLTESEAGKTVRVRVTFTDDAGTEETLASAATAAVNTPATGLPVIAGTPRVGETLEASAEGIADADGLTGAAFAWRWLAHDGTAESPIEDAAEAAYTLTPAEAGKTVRVRVAFTDDAGGEEILASAATAEVAADARPVAATLAVGGAAADPERFQVRIAFEAEVTGLEAAELGAAKVGGGAAVVSDLAVAEAGRAWTASVATAGAGRYAVRLGQGAAQAGARESTAAVLVADVDAEGNAVAVDAPAVTAVTLAPDPDGSWTAGDAVRVTLAFSEAVTVAAEDGTPALGIGLGANARQAAYAEGSGTAALVFAYAVTAADGTAEAVSVTADSLALNGATIRDAAARDADLAHPGIAAETVEPEAPAVLTGFTLVNLATVTAGTLADGAELTLDDPASGSYGIRVETAADASIGSVRLALSGAKTAARTENVAPFSLYGDDGATLAGEGLPAGAYTLAATAYAEGNLGGAVLQTLTVSFTVAASTVEPVDPDALTAAFQAVPEAHGGPDSTFVFRVLFSEAIPTSYKVLRDEAFQVSAGVDVAKARRVDGRDDLREIHVDASTWDDVTVTLPGNRACGTTGAICMSDGRQLSNSPTATVRGPVAIAVADAKVTEAPGATLDFVVSLSRAAPGTVTVDYATADGTATAGDDYTAASGTLSFAAGETAKTVSVAVLDDAHDEAEETMTLVLSNASGARIRDGEATGTIENSDAIPKAWLARFGRTVADHVVDAVGTRLAGSSGGGSQVTLGGQRLALGGAAGGAVAGADEADREAAEGLRSLADRMAGTGEGSAWTRWDEDEDEDASRTRTMTERELLLGSSFRLSLGGGDEAGAGGTSWTAWGRAAASSFDGEADGLALDGDVTTLTLGADAAWDRWLGGVAVAVSEGDGGFRDRADTGDDSRGSGRLSSSLTSVHPYARLSLGERLSVWGILGVGAGELELEVDGGERWTTDTTMKMAAVGARGVVVAAPAAGGVELGIRTDAVVQRMHSERATGSGGGNLAATDAGTSRVRLALEGSRAFALEGGGAFTPSVELGVRRDGGDAETGTGVELGAGLRYSDPSRRLAVDARARGLVAHEDADYREWGASASVRIDPDASGRGLSLSVTPAWGAAGGGPERLWSLPDARGLAADDAFEPGTRLDAELGYGLSVLGGRGVATPHLGFSRAGERETLTLGQRLRLGRASEWRVEGAFADDGRVWSAGYGYRLGGALDFGVEATRREAANDDAPEHGIRFRARLRW